MHEPPSDTQRPLACLHGCGALRELYYDGIMIDVCPSCRGVWLDKSELPALIKRRDQQWSDQLIDHVLSTLGQDGIPAEELAQQRHCPLCHTHMDAVNYQGNSGVIIDTCPKGHGVWLDHNELGKIRIFMAHWQRINHATKPA